MDSSGRVGNITSSSSIKSTNSRESSRGKTSNVDRGGRRDTDLASSSNNRGSSISVGISKTSIAKTSISKTSISSKIVGISISFSFPLGNMDSSSRVGNITSSSSIKSTNSRESSRSKTSNVDGGRGRYTDLASSSNNRGSSIGVGISKSGISKTRISKTSISKTSISKTGTISSKIVGISFSFPLGNMDCSSRVGNITPSSSIKSTNSRDSSRSKSSNVDGGGRRDTDLASSSNYWGISIGVGISKTGISKTSISQTRISISTISQTSIAGTISSQIVGVSFS